MDEPEHHEDCAPFVVHEGTIGKVPMCEIYIYSYFFLSKFDFQIFKTNIEDFNVLIVSFLIYFPKIYGT